MARSVDLPRGPKNLLSSLIGAMMDVMIVAAVDARGRAGVCGITRCGAHTTSNERANASTPTPTGNRPDYRPSPGSTKPPPIARSAGL